MVAMGRELRMSLQVRVLVDASAALGVAQRQGIGKIRHLQTGALWLQEQELRKLLRLKKVNGSENCSDMMTKNVSREIIDRHSKAMSIEFRDGRAENAVHLHLVQRRIRQAKAELRALKDVKVKHDNEVHIDHGIIEKFTDDYEAGIEELEEKYEMAIGQETAEWGRRLCKQEGAHVSVRRM